MSEPRTYPEGVTSWIDVEHRDIEAAKMFLLFLALLPQFTDPAADWPLAAQVASLGLVHVTSCAFVYTGVGIGGRLVLRASHRGPSGDPLLRCCDGAGRCAAAGRATGRG